MLTYNVIEYISEYLLPMPHRFSWAGEREICSKLTLTRDFISMMNVCREWRLALLSRYYRTAMVQISREYNPYMKINSATDINNAYLDMVRELVISLDLTTLLLPDNDPKHFRATLAAIPTFPSAHRISVYLNSKYGITLESQDTELPDEEAIERFINVNMPALAKYIHNIAPNANKLCWQNVCNLNNSCFSIKMHKAASQMANVFMKPELSQLYLADSLTDSLLQIPFVPTQLRSLCVQNTGTNGIDYELAIRNSGTLEYLRILCSTMEGAKILIYDPSLPNSTRVYPQLQCLAIGSYAPEFNSNIEQLQSNPFPLLKALMCEGIFPFNAPKIFLDGLDRITHLKFMMDWTLYTIFENEHVLDKGAFTNLCYLSTELRRTFQYDFDEDEDIKALTQTTVELSSSTRVLKLPRHTFDEQSSFLLSLEYPSFLQQLTLAPKPIGVDDLIMLLSKLDCLQQVTVSFQCCLGCSRTQGPSNESIWSYQRKFENVNASVYMLNMNVIGSRFALKAAENLVLLTDVLPNVIQVQFYSRPQTGEDTLDYIHKARLRSMYKDNKRLQRVSFTESQTEIL